MMPLSFLILVICVFCFYPHSSKGKAFYPYDFFQDFLVFGFLQFEYYIPKSISLVFIIHGIFWASWVYSVMSVVNSGKFPAIINLNISYVTFSLLLSQLHVWHTISNHINMLVIFLSFFSFVFQFGKFILTDKLTDYFIGHIQSFHEPTEIIFYFFNSVYNCSIFIYFLE